MCRYLRPDQRKVPSVRNFPARFELAILTNAANASKIKKTPQKPGT
jgi:hypothetical protein